jgi:hypothetical protein
MRGVRPRWRRFWQRCLVLRTDLLQVVRSLLCVFAVILETTRVVATKDLGLRASTPVKPVLLETHERNTMQIRPNRLHLATVPTVQALPEWSYLLHP